jgi:hypothetical protein
MDNKNLSIVANKALSINNDYFGKLTEKAFAGLTEFSTFFSEDEFNSYVFEKIKRTKNRDFLRSIDGYDRKEVCAIIASNLTEKVLSDEMACAKVQTVDGNFKYTSPDLVRAERDLVKLSNQMASNSGDVWFDDKNFDRVQEVYKEENKIRGWSLVEGIRDNMDYILSPGCLKIFDGPPGTGKSCIGEALMIGVMIDETKEPKRMVVSAPTDKAAGAFRADTEFTSEYMKNLTGREMPVESFSLPLLIDEMEKGSFDENTFVLIDEAGLMGTRDMVKAVKAASKAGVKLYLLGDNRQISPKEAGNGFDLMVLEAKKENDISVVTLDKVLRQSNGNDAVATKLLREGHGVKALENYAEKSYEDGTRSMSFVEDASEVLDNVCDEYISHLVKNPKDADVVAMTETSKEALKINKRVVAGLKAEGILKNTTVFETKKGKKELSEGEAVLFDTKLKALGGNTDGNIVNAGTAGFVSKIENDKVHFELEGKKKAVVSAKDVFAAKSAYALSNYAGQGVSKSRVFLAVTGETEMDLTAGLVAFSRHTKQLNSFVSKKAYNDYKALGKSMMKINRNELVYDYEKLDNIKCLETKSVAKLVSDKLSRGK